jgi:hypothetical protein
MIDLPGAPHVYYHNTAPQMRSTISHIQMEGDMSTLLIILLLVILFGGGGWGYSRWRR